MAKKTAIDKLDAAIKDILDEYGDDVQKNLDEAVADVTKKGATAVRQSVREKGLVKTGGYAKGWTSKVEKERLYSHGIIYNARKPGLPHLLENGHAKRGGGRVSGEPHIAPVEERIVESFERKVKSEISRLG